MDPESGGSNQSGGMDFWDLIRNFYSLTILLLLLRTLRGIGGAVMWAIFSGLWAHLFNSKDRSDTDQYLESYVDAGQSGDGARAEGQERTEIEKCWSILEKVFILPNSNLTGLLMIIAEPA